MSSFRFFAGITTVSPERWLNVKWSHHYEGMVWSYELNSYLMFYELLRSSKWFSFTQKQFWHHYGQSRKMVKCKNVFIIAKDWWHHVLVCNIPTIVMLFSKVTSSNNTFSWLIKLYTDFVNEFWITGGIITINCINIWASY